MFSYITNREILSQCLLSSFHTHASDMSFASVLILHFVWTAAAMSSSLVAKLWPWTFHIRSAAIRYLWTIDQNMKTFSDECSRNSGVYENREYRPTICLMIMYHTCIMSWSIVLELVRLTRSFTLASPPCGTCCQRRRVWRLLRTHFVWLRLRGLGRRHV